MISQEIHTYVNEGAIEGSNLTTITFNSFTNNIMSVFILPLHRSVFYRQIH
jgi:hypothetical protein